MAEDQERGERIKALKESRPDLTWKRIADYVGVTERSALAWTATGGIDYANADKLAELFEVDTDYVWRGKGERRRPTPDLSRSDVAVREVLEEIQHELAQHAARVENLLAMQNALLERQGAILDRIESRLGADEAVRDEIAEIIDQRRHEIVQGLPPASTPDPKPKPPRSQASAKKRAAARRTP